MPTRTSPPRTTPPVEETTEPDYPTTHEHDHTTPSIATPADTGATPTPGATTEPATTATDDEG
ncbi:hypothetical protein GCM10011610_21180 [Nocardia rhizosphaerihabitans]|uniref:Uncharacterized protein n=1 Tax=Nocardia rhizosphaerihabitans TaxID=1691570 RepID=A0ABQ2K927_9NOCA|nr:hypothetical protein GCM10011610_21180 [Nocardia rhizosphaerihabitans]